MGLCEDPVLTAVDQCAQGFHIQPQGFLDMIVPQRLGNDRLTCMVNDGLRLLSGLSSARVGLPPVQWTLRRYDSSIGGSP